MVKNNCGMASFNGILSVFLAKNGFTGPTNIFEGETGFWKMIGSDRFFPGRLTKDWGKRYRIMKIFFKTYPCGSYMHSSVDAVLKAIRLNKINIKEMDSILIMTHPFVEKILSGKDPKNPVHGAFSLPFVISLELLKIPYGFDEQFKKNIRNKEVLKLMELIKVEGRLPKEQKNREYYPAEAMIKVGRKTYRAKVGYPSGTTKNPMSMDQLKEKFFRLTGDTLGKEKAKRLFEKLINIETADNIKKKITRF